VTYLVWGVGSQHGVVFQIEVFFRPTETRLDYLTFLNKMNKALDTISC